MPGRLPRLPGVVATVDTAGEGYFVGGTVTFGNQLAALLVTAIDQVAVFQFVLPFRAKVAQISWWVTTGGGSGKKLGIGIYDANKNLLLESGAVDGNTTGQAVVSITAVTLEPGIYWLAATSDSATTQVVTLEDSSTVGQILNKTATLFGTAANAATAGVLPATLGTITAATTRAAIMAVFAP